MGFSLSGSNITQSGTDTNLSGLSGISGVTTIDVGRKVIYDIGNRRLRIEGTLSFDANDECITSSTWSSPTETIEINNRGTMTIEGHRTINGFEFPSYAHGILLTQENLAECCNNGHLTVNSGGTLNLYGAHIQVGSVIDWKSGSTIDIRNGKISTTRPGTTSGEFAVRIRNSASNLDIDGLICEGLAHDLFVVPDSFSGFQSIGVDNLHGLEAVSTPGATFRDFGSSGSAVGLDNWNNESLYLINPVGGTNTIITNSAQGDDRVILTKEVELSVSDISGNGIEGVQYYISDTDNGERATVDGYTGAETNDIVYSGSTDSNGNVSLFEVAIGFSREGDVQNKGQDQLDQIMDIRGENTEVTVQVASASGNTANIVSSDTLISNLVSGDGFQLTEMSDSANNGTWYCNEDYGDTTSGEINCTRRTPDSNPVNASAETAKIAVRGIDQFSINWIGYSQLYAQQTVNLNGAGSLSTSFTLFSDAVITESTKSTVDSYTELETPQKFYDRAKSYLVDNYSGENETLVSRSGSEIDLGAYDLDIDATASSAFSLSGNKITIHADNFEGDLTTTGTITLLNGAQVIGTRTDQNGTIAPPVTVTLTGLKADSEVRAYVGTDPATATEIDGVENSTTSFTFTQEEAGNDGFIVIAALSYENIKLDISYTSENQTIPIQQRFDRNYKNPD